MIKASDWLVHIVVAILVVFGIVSDHVDRSHDSAIEQLEKDVNNVNYNDTYFNARLSTLEEHFGLQYVEGTWGYTKPHYQAREERSRCAADCVCDAKGAILDCLNAEEHQ